jgi:hypothetical protein
MKLVVTTCASGTVLCSFVFAVTLSVAIVLGIKDL